jgi:hypothetical protein
MAARPVGLMIGLAHWFLAAAGGARDVDHDGEADVLAGDPWAEVTGARNGATSRRECGVWRSRATV